jgi:hypothetical protein
MIKELISIGNELDQRGLRKEADELDCIIKKVATLPLWLLFELGVGGKLGAVLAALKYKGEIWNAFFGKNEFIDVIRNLESFVSSGSGEGEEELVQHMVDWTGDNEWRVKEIDRWLREGSRTTGGHRDELLKRYRDNEQSGDEYFQYLLGHGEDETQLDPFSPHKERLSLPGDIAQESTPIR